MYDDKPRLHRESVATTTTAQFNQSTNRSVGGGATNE